CDRRAAERERAPSISGGEVMVMSDEEFDKDSCANKDSCLEKARDINREILKAKQRWIEAAEHAKECRKTFESNQDRLNGYLISLDMPLFEALPEEDWDYPSGDQEGTQAVQGEDYGDKTTDLPCQSENVTQSEPEPLQEKPKKRGWPKGKPRGDRKTKDEAGSWTTPSPPFGSGSMFDSSYRSNKGKPRGARKSKD